MVNKNETDRRRAIWSKAISFRPMFLAFILILSISTIVFGLSLVYPITNEILKASWGTPWGIATSLFAHNGFEHYSMNMIGLSVYFLLFFITNLLLPKEEIYKRVKLSLIAMFLIAVISNFVWIVLVPQSSTLGSSGLVYASQGVMMGFALMNCLRIIELPHKSKRDKAWFLLFCLSNLIIFVVAFSQILLQPQVFLSVGLGVNVVVHGLSFYAALILVVVWSIIRQFGRTLKVRKRGMAHN